MDDHRHAVALTDAALERDIARALAVDPSPDFLARVRSAVANEPAPSSIAGAFSTWRRAFALGVLPAAGAAAIATIALGVVVMRPDRVAAPAASLSARAIAGPPVSVPDVASGLSLRYAASDFSLSNGASGFSRTNRLRTSAGPASDGPPKGGRPAHEPIPLLDPRETRALRAFIAGVRDNRVDLTPLLKPGIPAPMELAPIVDLVISPLAIEPLAPADGVQGARQ
jgi:hypothetical protein